jgi:hypothetical protein
VGHGETHDWGGRQDTLDLVGVAGETSQIRLGWPASHPRPWGGCMITPDPNLGWLTGHPMAWQGVDVGFLNPAASMAIGCALWVVVVWEHWSLRAGIGRWMLHKFHRRAGCGSPVGWAWCWWLGMG